MKTINLLIVVPLFITALGAAVKVPVSESPGTCDFLNLPTCEFNELEVWRYDGSCVVEYSGNDQLFADIDEMLMNCSSDQGITLTVGSQSIDTILHTSWSVNAGIGASVGIIEGKFEGSVGENRQYGGSYTFSSQDFYIGGCKKRNINRKGAYKIESLQVVSLYECRKSVKTENLPDCEVGSLYSTFPGGRVSVGTRTRTGFVNITTNPGPILDCQ